MNQRWIRNLLVVGGVSCFSGYGTANSLPFDACVKSVGKSGHSNQIQRLIASCLEKYPSPFVGRITVEVRSSGFHLTNLDDFSVFLPKEVESCVQNVVEGVRPDRLAGSVDFSPLVESLEIEFYRTAEGSSFQATDEVSCTSMSEKKLNISNANPLRDLLHVRGTPMEGDALYQRLESCRKFAVRFPETGTIIGEVMIDYYSVGNKQKVTGLKVEFPPFGKKYADCLQRALLPFHEELSRMTSNVEVTVVDGETKPLGNTKSRGRHWLMVVISDKKDAYYHWPKLGGRT